MSRLERKGIVCSKQSFRDPSAFQCPEFPQVISIPGRRKRKIQRPLRGDVFEPGLAAAHFTSAHKSLDGSLSGASF